MSLTPTYPAVSIRLQGFCDFSLYLSLYIVVLHKEPKALMIVDTSYKLAPAGDK